MQHEHFIQAYEQPQWGALFSLPANLATAMLLVDYALHGLTTPTPWPLAVAPRLSERARQDLEGMRPLLGHGAVLREFFLQQLPANAPQQRDWQALRAWLAGLNEELLTELVVYGLRSNLDYYLRNMQPDPAVERWLAELESRDPWHVDLSRLEQRLAAGRAVIISWDVEDLEPSLLFVREPMRLHDVLLRFLDELWQQGFQQVWERSEGELKQAVLAAGALLHADAASDTALTLIFRVTGLQPAEEWTALLRGAARVIFIPCLHLGKYLSVATIGSVSYILYEPARLQRPARALRVVRETAALEELAPEEAEPSALLTQDLESLSSGLEALGDATRVAILMLLAERGELFALQVAEELNVHQSTISRHFALLERTSLVQVRRSGGMKFYTLNRGRVQEIARLLLAALA